MPILSHQVGAAQNPRSLPWAENTSGARAAEDVPQLLQQRGIAIGDDVRLFAVERTMLPPDAWAQYCDVNAHASYTWEQFLCEHPKHPEWDAYVPVKYDRDLLGTDEGLIAVLSHELYEIDRLRQMFADRGSIPGKEIARLICAGIDGNLHCRAWDHSDRHVAELRGAKP